MTVLVDIGCPDCGRTEPVRKVGIGRYRCGECGREFTESEVRAAD
jgi:transposase-like protein